MHDSTFIQLLYYSEYSTLSLHVMNFRLLILVSSSYIYVRYFIVQTDDHNINRNQLLVRYANIIVPIVSMLFKYKWSIVYLVLYVI